MNKILAICITLVTLGVLIGTSAAPAGDHDVDNITLRCHLGEHQCWYLLGGCKGLDYWHDDSGPQVSLGPLVSDLDCKWNGPFGSEATHMRAFPLSKWIITSELVLPFIPSELVLLHIYETQDGYKIYDLKRD